MNNLPIKISASSIRSVSESIVPGLSEAPWGSTLVFELRIDSERIVARDFAAFLEFVDRVYGRSLKKDFRSYARKSYGHFTFERSRTGSWKLIAEQALGFASNASPLVILWLVLKYLPAVIQSTASSYNQIEQGRLAREKRKKIREEMKRDNQLTNVPDEKKAELARLVEGVASQERALLPRVRRFMKDSFLGVRTYIQDAEDDDS